MHLNPVWFVALIQDPTFEGASFVCLKHSSKEVNNLAYAIDVARRQSLLRTVALAGKQSCCAAKVLGSAMYVSSVRLMPGKAVW